MTERFSIKPAVYIIVVRDGAILLQRRFNTGFMDGCYGLLSGHLDGNESVRCAAAREAEEEVGLALSPDDLAVVHVMHRKGP
jgi:8-oxo-dGTP diphosphatase